MLGDFNEAEALRLLESKDAEISRLRERLESLEELLVKRWHESAYAGTLQSWMEMTDEQYQAFLLGAAASSLRPAELSGPPSLGCEEVGAHEDGYTVDADGGVSPAAAPEEPAPCATCGGTGVMRVLTKVLPPDGREVYEDEPCANPTCRPAPAQFPNADPEWPTSGSLDPENDYEAPVMPKAPAQGRGEDTVNPCSVCGRGNLPCPWVEQSGGKRAHVWCVPQNPSWPESGYGWAFSDRIHNALSAAVAQERAKVERLEALLDSPYALICCMDGENAEWVQQGGDWVEEVDAYWQEHHGDRFPIRARGGER